MYNPRMPRTTEKKGYTPVELNDQALEKMRADLLARLRTLLLNDAPFDPTTLGPLKPGWNTAVGQMFFLMNVVPELISSPSLNLYKPHYPQISGQVRTPFRNDFQEMPIVNMEIKPGTLIETFVTPNELDLYTDYALNTTSEQLKEKLAVKNGSWLLCGAISPESVFNMLAILEKHGFSGRLDIVDAGQNSFQSVAAFSDLYAYYYPQIQINHVKANLLYATLDHEISQAEARTTSLPDADDDGIFLPYDGYDGITADTIGTYISNDSELYTHFGAVFYSLKPGGIAFIRDMARGQQKLNDENRHISQALKMPTIQKAKKVQTFIAESLGIEVPYEYCYSVIKHLFSGEGVHEPHRWDYLNDLWRVTVPAELVALRNIAIDGSDVHQRWFAEFVFQKE